MCKRRLSRNGVTRMRRPKDNVRLRLERMRTEYYLGESIETNLRGQNLDPECELGIREVMRRVETGLTPRARTASSH